MYPLVEAVQMEWICDRTKQFTSKWISELNWFNQKLG